jgi:hypothetical protein
MWKPSDMSGISREVTEHSLKIRPGSKPVKQRLRRFNEESVGPSMRRFQSFWRFRFIKEVYHPEWLVNPVLIKKEE